MSKDANYLSPLEREVIAEMNLARKDPTAYAQHLLSIRGYFVNKEFRAPGKVPVLTDEGLSAVDDAISALYKQKSCGELKPSKGMSRAAKDHVNDIGPKGLLDHTGSDGSSPFTRIKRYGQWKDCAAENLGFGESTAREIVIQWIVDDGVPSRGHRKTLFKDNIKLTGVAFGPHKLYGVMCCATYAGIYIDDDTANMAPKQEQRPATAPAAELLSSFGRKKQQKFDDPYEVKPGQQRGPSAPAAALAQMNDKCKCDACSKPLYGQFAKVGSKQYHMDCFTCAKCSRALVSGYQVKGDRLVCMGCAASSPAPQNGASAPSDFGLLHTSLRLPGGSSDAAYAQTTETIECVCSVM